MYASPATRLFFWKKQNEVRLGGSRVITPYKHIDLTRSLALLPDVAGYKDKHSRMTKQRVGMGNCILGLGDDVGTNTWHESHIF